MGTVIKLTIKNIFKKPFRTFMVVFCVMVCSFTALLSFDMSGAIENMIRGVFSSQIGDVDIMASGLDMDLDFLKDENLPKMDYLTLSYAEDSFFRPLEGEYTYVHKDVLTIFGLDMDMAFKLKILNKSYPLKEEEVLLSKEFGDLYGYKAGDTIVLHDVNEQELNFTVAEVVDFGGKGILEGNKAIVSQAGFERLCAWDGNARVADILMNLEDESKAAEVKEYLETNYPEYAYENVISNPELTQSIADITGMFFLLFAICLLMVIFVTVSVSERIVCERMAVVGTLRSLGLSSGLTTRILLLENSFYGLAGSILGCWIYSGIRNVILGSMFTLDLGNGKLEMEFGTIKPYLLVVVVLVAIILECLCPLKEIIKAVRTPIRDIIFNNKDTEYRFHKAATRVGLFCLAVALVLLVLPPTFAGSMVTLFSFTVALALLFPYILHGGSRLLEKWFDKRNKPMAKLAAIECRSKKSTVGGSVLITTAAALSIVVYTLSCSLKADFQYVQFDCDVIAMLSGSKGDSVFSYLKNQEGVRETELVSISADYLRINEQDEKIFSIISIKDGGFSMFSSLEGVPENLQENEVVVDEYYAQKMGWKEGDVLHISFKDKYYYPIEKDLTIKTLMNAYHYEGSGAVVGINESLYRNIYGNSSSYLLLRGEQPEELKKLVEKYSSKYIVQTYTREEYEQYIATQSMGVIVVLNALIVMGVGLTFIGAVSNLLIGFEGRKREMAVLLSTAVPRKKLRQMLVMESFFATGISLLTALPAGLLLVKPVTKALEAITLRIPVVIYLGEYVGFVMVLWIVFTLTAIFPLRVLKKMKIAEQLKYE